MNNIRVWIKEHKSKKKFIVSSLVFGFMAILLIGEFIWLNYSVLKIIRNIVLLAGLFVMAWIDGESHRIPNKLLLMLCVFRMVLLVIECFIYYSLSLTIMFSAFLGMIAGTVIFGSCYLISRGGMGAGDVKLFAVIGFFTNIKSVMLIAFFSVCAAAVYSIAQLVRKKIDFKAAIPFGPFAMIGAVLTFALGI
ncbi:MAG: prepilin peptidase [Clostridiales bacterium]|nr:prepilin peptidase [Clostridiales bacterium]